MPKFFMFMCIHVHKGMCCCGWSGESRGVASGILKMAFPLCSLQSLLKLTFLSSLTLVSAHCTYSLLSLCVWCVCVFIMLADALEDSGSDRAPSKVSEVTKGRRLCTGVI